VGRSSVTAHLDLGRRVALRALAAFLLAFVILRVITAIIHFELVPHGPFRNLVTKSGLHIHHLFWGILLLMLTGFVALATRSPVWHLRIAIVFGIALALTLDEFALWLCVADVYWSPKRVSGIYRVDTRRSSRAGEGVRSRLSELPRRSSAARAA